MKRETLKLALETIAKMQNGIDQCPHGFAKNMLAQCEELEGILVGEEFNGQEVIGSCESCEAIILSDDDFQSGDCFVCAECCEKYRAEGFADGGET